MTETRSARARSAATTHNFSYKKAKDTILKLTNKHCEKSVRWNTNVKVGDDWLDYSQVGGERLLQRRLLPRPPHQAGRRGQDQGALKVRSGGLKEMSSILADQQRPPYLTYGSSTEKAKKKLET